MALTPEQIEDIATDWFSDERAVDRAIKLIEQVEAEVRKQDDALIQQLVEALQLCVTGCDYLTEVDGVTEAITAGRARLEKAP